MGQPIKPKSDSTMKKENLLLMAASLLGFGTACDKEEQTLVMYGTPYNNYRVKGTVTDPDGNPIEGIEVCGNNSPETAVLTGADGSFEIAGRSIGQSVKLGFTDIDGPDNGGDFASGSLDIRFTEEERTAEGSGAWHKGDFARTGVEMTLEKNEQE